MAEVEPQLRPLRFADFEVDLRTGELRKAGAKLKFGGQPFQVLSILLERPGDIFTREELQKRLWPNTFVDVDHNLNTAINKIREVLGDSAETPQFIETLPRRGYRFIGELELPPNPEAAAEPARQPLSRRRLFRIAVAILALSAVALATVAAYRWFRRPMPQEQAVLQISPLTALPGDETAPALSPDGSRIAFGWTGDDPASSGKGYDLYVKAIGSETMLRMTHHRSEWLSPTWSPDGTQIAFHRFAGADTGIYVVPALGGPEQKLRATRDSAGLARLVSWSPDGKWIAFSDPLQREGQARIYLLSPATGEAQRLRNSPDCMSEVQPAFSHNGEYLAFWCLQSSGESSLYSLPLRGGRPNLVLHLRDLPFGLAWSASDKELIYAPANSSELLEVAISNGSVKRLALTENSMWPTVSSRGDKLAYQSKTFPRAIWRRDLLHPESPAIELNPSTRAQYNAQYSPDGTRVAFASERSGVQGVWVSGDDGSNLVQLSNPRDMSGSPQWSPDGKKVAFDSKPLDHWEIYVVDVAERIPRKLVTNISNVYRPHWSRDGKWIYFASSEIGRAGAYRCPASGGDAIALSKEVDGLNAQESFDGTTVYFVNGDRPKATLMKLVRMAPPGRESEVDGLPSLNGPELWTLSPGGIYFVPAEAPGSLRFFDFATKRVRPVFEVDKGWGQGLSISPNGRWIIYSQSRDRTSEIMLVDHFH